MTKNLSKGRLSPEKISLVTPAENSTIDADISGRTVRVGAQTLADAIGWNLKPEGFCQGDICIPARDAVSDDGSIDLTVFAKLVRTPIICDIDEKVVSLGTPVDARCADLESLRAPDFSLPDLDGKMHALSDYKGKKILLAAYASW